MTENTSRFNHGKSLGKVKKISNTEKMKIKYNSYATRKSVNYFSCLHATFHTRTFVCTQVRDQNRFRKP